MEYRDGKNVLVFAYFTISQQIAQICSEPLFDPEEVEGYVNDLKMYEYYPFPGTIFLWSEYYLSSGETHKLKIYFPKESADGETKIPSYLFITFPPYDTVLSLDEAKIIWRKTQDTDWYFSDLYFYFYDSLGYTIGTEEKFVNTKDTFVEIKPIIEKWFSDSGASYAETEAYILPVSCPLPSEPGNIKGDARGYLLGYGDGDYVYFKIGKVPWNKGKKKFVLKKSEKIKNKLIEKIKEEFLSSF